MSTRATAGHPARSRRVPTADRHGGTLDKRQAFLAAKVSARRPVRSRACWHRRSSPRSIVRVASAAACSLPFVCDFLGSVLAQGVVEAFRLQAGFCAAFGSPLYAELLRRCADDVERGGPVACVLDGWTGNPVPDALVLRLMGAVHFLVLGGAAPELARFYPSVGGAPAFPGAWEAFVRVIETHTETLRAALDRHVQTNEVRRSAALLGGFLTIAASHRLALRVLEIGSSAGLNLCWDRYRYEVVAASGKGQDSAVQPVWGDAESPVTIRTEWTGPLEVFGTDAVVAERGGCDVAPVDVSDAAQVRVLESFVWADQIARLQQLRAAVALARRSPPPLVRRRAADWLDEQLATPCGGVTTVVFHSIMWWYLSEEERERVTAIIARAGGRASERAPLAWLRLELMTATDPDLLVTRWPGGDQVRLARADAHGRYVRWGARD